MGIASSAFARSMVANIIIPQSVRYINSNAFHSSKLVDDAKDNSIVYADKWAVGYKGDIFYEQLRDDTVGITDGAFSYSETLGSLTIPSSVKSIGDKAFILSSITDISIREGLKVISDSAFLYCSSFQSINIPATVTEIGSGAFAGCNSLTIFATVDSKPNSWSEKWNPDSRQVVWGHNG